jgi:hypothetical protein
MALNLLNIPDIITRIIAFIAENDYPELRLVQSDWNNAVRNNLKKGSAHTLVCKKHYLSAVNNILSSRKERVGYPLRPNKVLIAACKIYHIGIINLLLTKPIGALRYDYPLRLLRARDFAKGIVDTFLLFYKHGYQIDQYIDINYAAECNSAELVKICIDRANHHDLSNAFHYALRYKNVEMAKIMFTSPKFMYNIDLEYIIGESIDIAIIYLDGYFKEFGPNIYLVLKNKYKSSRYAPVMDKMRGIFCERSEHIKREIAINKIFNKICNDIKSTLLNKYPCLPRNGLSIRFAVHKSIVEKIDWNKNWSFKYRDYHFSVNATNPMSLCVTDVYTE